VAVLVGLEAEEPRWISGGGSPSGDSLGFGEPTTDAVHDVVGDGGVA
jgi:hypothetical protein